MLFLFFFLFYLAFQSNLIVQEKEKKSRQKKESISKQSQEETWILFENARQRNSASKQHWRRRSKFSWADEIVVVRDEQPRNTHNRSNHGHFKWRRRLRLRVREPGEREEIEHDVQQRDEPATANRAVQLLSWHVDADRQLLFEWLH